MPSTPTTRKRVIKIRLGKATGSASYCSPPRIYEFRGPDGSQVTESEGHPFWKNRSPSYDVGGKFTTTKKSMYTIGNQAFVCDKLRVASGTGTTPWASFNGTLLPLNPMGLSYSNDISSSDAALSVKGATAIARCSPTNPVANLSVFLGEMLKDGIPSIPLLRALETRARLAKSAGNEFLNIVFGWEPLKSDVENMAKAIIHSQTVLRQFERDAGKVVRRSYTFPTIADEETTLYASNVQPFYGRYWPENGGCNLSYIMPQGDVYRTRKTVRRTWFSGAFTFYLPSGYDSRNRMESASLSAKRVFGLELTPETLWNLAPWSWAVDWVSNAGDVLKNVSQHAQYGQVLRYGYIMEHSFVRDTYSFRRTGPPQFGVGPGSIPLLVVETETKKRRGASPFGFGLTWDGLSATQLAIAGALGLTKSKS